MKNIVILGCGFGGIACAIRLEHLLRDDIEKKKCKIYVIDKNLYHLFTPSLYEVSTVEEPQKNIVIPLGEIFKYKKINLLHKDFSKIDKAKKEIIFKDGEVLSYSYLVIALGSISNSYNIKGIDEYSYPLKTLNDAVNIKKKVFSLIKQDCKKIDIVIAGGGFSGTELAGEFLRYKTMLDQKGACKDKEVVVSLISGGDPVKELGEDTAKSVKARLLSLGLNLIEGEKVAELNENEVILSSGKRYPYSILIWTGGVKGNSILKDSIDVDQNGRIPVDKYMKAIGESNIYAIGDCAFYINPKTGRPVEGVCETAIGEGKAAAKNVYNSFKGYKEEEYKHKTLGFIVPLSGKYAYVSLKHLHLQGFLGWILQQLTFMNYLLDILPFLKAFKRWNNFEKHLSD